MCEFPVEEFHARIAALLSKMREAGLDGIMLSSRENTRYFCGLQSIIWSSKVSTPGILIINADGKTALVGSASAVETARYTSVLENEDVFCYDRNGLPGIPATYPDAIAAAFQHLGLTSGKVGAELGQTCYLQLQYHWYLELCSQLPAVQFVDAGETIFSLRAVKSPAELEILSHACLQNDASIDYAVSSIVPGQTTERDVYRKFAEEAFRRHCENVAELSVRFAAGRLPLTGCPAGNTVIEPLPHAPLFIGGGLLFRGYYGHSERTAVLGSLTNRQQLFSDCARQTAEFACELLRAGADVPETVNKIRAYAASTAAGEAYMAEHTLGFGLGLDLAERPYLTKSALSTSRLREGMVLTLFPCFGNESDGLFVSSVTLFITSSQPRFLSAPPNAPTVISL